MHGHRGSLSAYALVAERGRGAQRVPVAGMDMVRLGVGGAMVTDPAEEPPLSASGARSDASGGNSGATNPRGSMRKMKPSPGMVSASARLTLSLVTSAATCSTPKTLPDVHGFSLTQ